ncbi:MAG: type II toxin-antitoxin system RelE/ParE family toxin [Terriglobales bacterium]
MASGDQPRPVAPREWEVEFTDEFGAWYQQQVEELQDAIAAKVGLLTRHGPALGRPHAETLAKMSKHPNMKELRVVFHGDAYRILFAFDPRRVAVLLLGGRKPDEKWYKTAIPQADKLYDRLIAQLRAEGLIR